ncbi:type II toxin-antitoxin system VapC family toxin [Mucilaginibacter psychrotolerans]|nr:type II toxin-antitoxin system VapC family toxin [Mucilaginibacter psychrotolerans]
MTGSKCLLDTSVIIHSFKNNKQVRDRLETFDELYVNDIAIGELYHGAYSSLDPQKHINQVQLFLSSCFVIGVDTYTATIYGRLKTDLKRRGKPIPENDIWIAASSLAYNLPLFTTDKHFELLELELIPFSQ